MTDKELQLILSEGEAHKIEFKESVGGGLDKDLVALANNDRIEISNPGGLVRGLSPEDFGTKSILRNPTIATLLHRSRYVEKLGTGIAKMRSLLRKAKLPLPRFSFNTFFTVTFTRRAKKTFAITAIPNVVQQAVQQAVHDGIVDAVGDVVIDVVADAVGDAVDDAVKQRLVVGCLYFHQRESATLSEWRRIFNVSRPTAQRDIAVLKSQGLVLFKGSPKRGRYMLTKGGKNLFRRVK